MKKSRQDDVKTLLAPFRAEIDAIDDRIIALLGRRFRIVKKVSRIKEKYEIPIFQRARVREVKDRNAARARRHGVDVELVRTIYTLIIAQAHDMEDAFVQESRKKSGRKTGKAK